MMLCSELMAIIYGQLHHAPSNMVWVLETLITSLHSITTTLQSINSFYLKIILTNCITSQTHQEELQVDTNSTNECHV